MFQYSKTDDSRGECDPGPLDDSQPVVADAELTEALEPADGAFNNPADLVEDVSVRRTTPSNRRLDARPTQQSASDFAVDDDKIGVERSRFLGKAQDVEVQPTPQSELLPQAETAIRGVSLTAVFLGNVLPSNARVVRTYQIALNAMIRCPIQGRPPEGPTGDSGGRRWARSL